MSTQIPAEPHGGRLFRRFGLSEKSEVNGKPFGVIHGKKRRPPAPFEW